MRRSGEALPLPVQPGAAAPARGDRSDWATLRRLFPYLWEYKWRVLAALTFMYVSARAVGDADYRTRFLDPLIDDLRLTLVARSRYRAAATAAHQ